MEHEARETAIRWFAELLSAGLPRPEAKKVLLFTRAFAYKYNLPLVDVREEALAMAHQNINAFHIIKRFNAKKVKRDV